MFEFRQILLTWIDVSWNTSALPIYIWSYMFFLRIQTSRILKLSSDEPSTYADRASFLKEQRAIAEILCEIFLWGKKFCKCTGQMQDIICVNSTASNPNGLHAQVWATPSCCRRRTEIKLCIGISPCFQWNSSHICTVLRRLIFKLLQWNYYACTSVCFIQL